MAGPTMMGKTGILRTIYKRMLVEMRRTDGATYSRMLVPRIKSGSTKKRRLRATIQRLCNRLVTALTMQRVYNSLVTGKMGVYTFRHLWGRRTTCRFVGSARMSVLNNKNNQCQVSTPIYVILLVSHVGQKIVGTCSWLIARLCLLKNLDETFFCLFLNSPRLLVVHWIHSFLVSHRLFQDSPQSLAS